MRATRSILGSAKADHVEPPSALAFLHVLWDERTSRREAYERRLAREAYFLGHKLARHEIGRDQVEQALEHIVNQLDPDTWYLDENDKRVDVKVRLSWRSHELVGEALRMGIEEGSRGRPAA